ncbi:peptide ABC transporter substrate-binding protein [Patescibacteria group bacterium]|nr:peptide ABC transporter substrate-binding protein [Patescibacteria group bacterium]
MRLSSLLTLLRTRQPIPWFETLSAHIRSLSYGDKLIVSVLGLLVLGSSLAGLYALERSLLVEVPAQGGSLTEGIVGSPRFVNPLLALSDADRDLTALTYAGLMGVDSDGSLIPVLAESYTVSEDGKEYLFTLRTSARFSDNTPVTAEDVVFTVEKAQDPTLKSPELANWANIKAEIVDARTVRFLLPKPYAPFLVDTTLGILPAHLWRNIPVDEFPFSPLMTEPVGAGPFQAMNIVRGKKGTITSYELRAFPKFVLGRPYLDRIVLRFYDTTETLASAYRRGVVESAYGINTPGALRVPYSRVFGAFFNADENPVFAQAEVREALSLAIDRRTLVSTALGGNATPLFGPVPPGSGITQPEIPVEDGVLLATELLEESGWEQDQETGVWENVKEKLILETLTLKTSNVPELKAVATSIESDWERLGIQTEIELYEPGDLASSVIRPRAYEILLFGMVIGRDQDLFAFWDSGERSDPGLNIAGYANRSVDTLLESARVELNPEIARADLQKLSDVIASEYPAAFTHTPDFLYAVPQSVQGIRLVQITAPADRFAAVHTWYRRSELVWPFFVSQ